MREGNHLLINDELHDKIAFLSSIDKEKRHFVASSKFKNEAPFLMEQIACQLKARNKVPFMYERKCFYTQKSLEQATHPFVASWKAALISSQTKSNEIVCLTAGLGVDDYFFSHMFDKVISLDIDLHLHDISVYNNQKLGASNVQRINQSCDEYLTFASPKNKVIYLDPDRQTRSDSNNKNVSEFSPNILRIAPKLLEGQNIIFIKLSGVTDLNWIRNNIPDVSEIHIINLKKEVKEVLVKLENGANHTIPEISITKIHQSDFWQTWTMSQIEGIKKKLSTDLNAPLIFRPNNAIIKSSILRDNQKALSANTQYFLTYDDSLIEFGQLFRIQEILVLSLKQLQKHLTSIGLEKASVISRNSSLNSQATRAFLNLKESETSFILVFGEGKLNRVYITQRF